MSRCWKAALPFLLAAVIIARSTSYVLTKVGLQGMGKFTLLAVRFLLAFAFLAALFRRRLLLFRAVRPLRLWPKQPQAMLFSRKISCPWYVFY